MINNIFSFTIVLMGFSFIIMGLIIWKKQKINFIGGYNNRNVNKEDVKGFTESIGKTHIIMGVSISLLGIFGLSNNDIYEVVGATVFIVGLLISIVKFAKTQKKYKTGMWE